MVHPKGTLKNLKLKVILQNYTVYVFANEKFIFKDLKLRKKTFEICFLKNCFGN